MCYGFGYVVLCIVMIVVSDDKDVGEIWCNWMKDNICVLLCFVFVEIVVKKVVCWDFDFDVCVDFLIG